MLFAADGDPIGPIAGAGIGGVIAALTGSVLWLLQGWWTNRRQDAKLRAEDRDTIITRQEGHIKKLDNQVDEQQEAIRELWQSETDCEIELATLHGFIERLHDVTSRLADAAKRAGNDPGTIPPLPPRRSRKQSKSKTEFLARTTEHNTGLLKETDSTSGSRR